MTTRTDITDALETATRERIGALIVEEDSLTYVERNRITEFATARQLPAIYGYRDYVVSGGLISYGAKLPELIHRVLDYIDKMLKGAKPGDLPVARRRRRVLRDQRVAKFQTAEAAKVPIGCPQFAHTVESAQSGHARIVDVRAGDPPVPHHGFELTPVAFRLRQQRQTRRFQPRVDLIDGCDQVSRRRLNSWMRDDSQEFVQARPWNRPGRAPFGQLRQPRVGGVMPRGILAMGVDADHDS